MEAKTASQLDVNASYGTSLTDTARKASNTEVTTMNMSAYGLCVFGAFAIIRFLSNVDDGDISSILTISMLVQCLAFSFLMIRVIAIGSVSGLSANSLWLDTMSIILRLTSTTWLNGYIPVDRSGDHAYQFLDMVSLAMIGWLLYRMYWVNSDTLNKNDDSLRMWPMVLASFIIAILFHADLDDRPIFDTLWMASLYLGVFAVLPQHWLITQTNGRAEALSMHYVAALCVSRTMSGGFIFFAREDYSCREWIKEGFNHGLYVILAAHLAHVLLLGDLAYYYVSSSRLSKEPCKIVLSDGV